MARPKGAKNKPKLLAPIQVPEPAVPQPTSISVPPVAWSLENWRSRPDVQSQLQQLLDNNILRLAFQSLLVAGLPSSRAAIVPGVSAEAMTLLDSQRLHNRSGYIGFYRALHSLARLKNAPEPKAGWGVAPLLDDLDE
jgi:hypothetical protein